jgi:hypothetical protein
MRLYTAYGSARLNAYPVHGAGAGGDDGTEFTPVDGLCRPGAEMTGQPGDLGHVDARLDMTEAKCAAVPAVPTCLDTRLCAEPEVSPHMRRIQGREYQAAVLL